MRASDSEMRMSASSWRTCCVLVWFGGGFGLFGCGCGFGFGGGWGGMGWLGRVWMVWLCVFLFCVKATNSRSETSETNTSPHRDGDGALLAVAVGAALAARALADVDVLGHERGARGLGQAREAVAVGLSLVGLVGVFGCVVCVGVSSQALEHLSPR
jgi:hypothetical protein